MYKCFIKRLIDLIISVCGLAVLALPMALIAIVVKADSQGSVLFWQKRVGIHKSTFMMPKFRTMYTNAPANMPTHMLNDPSKWITKSGAWLRKLSLDELPQIFCIITGKMSVIGPRQLWIMQYCICRNIDKYKRNSIVRFSIGCPPNHSLRQWLVRQRSLMRLGKLSQQQVSKINLLNKQYGIVMRQKHV